MFAIQKQEAIKLTGRKNQEKIKEYLFFDNASVLFAR
jgi:hypothetical protein